MVDATADGKSTPSRLVCTRLAGGEVDRGSGALSLSGTDWMRTAIEGSASLSLGFGLLSCRACLLSAVSLQL